MAFDSDDGQQMLQWWTINTAFNDGGGDGGGIRWRRQHFMVFDGVGEGLRQINGEANMDNTMRR